MGACICACIWSVMKHSRCPASFHPSVRSSHAQHNAPSAYANSPARSESRWALRGHIDQGLTAPSQGPRHTACTNSAEIDGAVMDGRAWLQEASSARIRDIAVINLGEVHTVILGAHDDRTRP